MAQPGKGPLEDYSTFIERAPGPVCVAGWGPRGSALHINGMHTFLANLHGRPSIDRYDCFFANNSLIIEFNWILVKLKLLPMKFPWNNLFLQFFDVLQLSYKPSNNASANKPYVVGSRVKGTSS